MKMLLIVAVRDRGDRPELSREPTLIVACCCFLRGIGYFDWRPDESMRVPSVREDLVVFEPLEVPLGMSKSVLLVRRQYREDESVCPGCLTRAALAVAGATSAGGLTAFTVKVLRKRGQERPGSAEGPYDGESTVDATGRKPAAVAPSVPDDTRRDPDRCRGETR